MKRGRNGTLLVTAAIAAAVMCSCADSENTRPLNTPAGGLPEKDVTLSVWCAKQDMDMISEMIEAFKAENKNYNLTAVISIEEETSCRETILADTAGAADIFSFPDDQFYDLKKAGMLKEVPDANDIIAANGGAEAGAILSATMDGKLYAYPSTASNGYFMYYNKAYYTEDDVKSLENMLRIAADNGKYVTIDFTSGWYLYSFFKAAGLSVDMDKEHNRNTCDWNSTDGRYKGTDVFRAMLNVTSSAGFRNDTDNAFTEGIKDGSVIAGISGTWNAKNVSEAFGENYGACKLPTVNIAGDDLQMHSFAGFKLIGVNNHTKYPECACALAKWITNEENQKKRFSIRGEGPSNIRAAADPAVQADTAISALLEQSAYAHVQNVASSYWNASSYLGIMAAAGVIDDESIQKTLDKVTEDITAAS